MDFKKKYHGPVAEQIKGGTARLLDYRTLDDGQWAINYLNITGVVMQKMFRLKQPTSLEVHKTITLQETVMKRHWM